MFCKKCGVKLVEGSAFCHVCGASTVGNNQGLNNSTPNMTPVTPKKKKKGLVIGIIAGVLVLALLIVGAVILMQGKGTVQGDGLPFGLEWGMDENDVKKTMEEAGAIFVEEDSEDGFVGYYCHIDASKLDGLKLKDSLGIIVSCEQGKGLIAFNLMPNTVSEVDNFYEEYDFEEAKIRAKELEEWLIEKYGDNYERLAPPEEDESPNCIWDLEEVTIITGNEGSAVGFYDPAEGYLEEFNRRRAEAE